MSWNTWDRAPGEFRPLPFRAVAHFPAGGHVVDHLLAGRVVHRHGPHQVQGTVDHLLGGGDLAHGHQAVDHRPDPRKLGVPKHLGSVVDPVDQAAAVHPFLAHLPALHRGRLQQFHPHVLHFQVGGQHAVLDARRCAPFASLPALGGEHPGPGLLVQGLRHANGPHHQLGRVLHLGEVGRLVLEEIGGEQDPQHLFYFVAGVEVGLLQRLQGLSVPGLRQPPGTRRRLIGYEPVVQFS